MEQIYTVKVKCKPDPRLNYPSERTYSSSTIGGLAFSHLFLAGLGLALCLASYQPIAWRGEYFGGLALITGAISTGVAGILAWKKWYVNHYIRWFLFSSVISICCAVTSIALTALMLVSPDLVLTDPQGPSTSSNITDDDPRVNMTTLEDPYPVGTIPQDLSAHLLVASFMELLLSLLSVKISWKGVKNSYLGRPPAEKRPDGVGGYPDKPDILDDHKMKTADQRLSNYSNVVKELCKLQKSAMLKESHLGHDIVSAWCIAGHNDKDLPLPETRKEYMERMEKFLTSQEKCKVAPPPP